MPVHAVSLDNVAADVGRVILEHTQAECSPLLRSTVGALSEPLSTMAGYHFGWWDVDRSPIRGPSGKFLRAGLVITAASACGGSSEDAIAIAAAVELVHNFTLLHDDVMDRDETRRGRPTVWRVWGVENAILLGDALHAAAIRLLADSCEPSVAIEAIRRLETCCLDLCVGQFEDCLFDVAQEIRVADYLRMAGGKTAALIGCCCALGALSANADGDVAATLERFGYELGVAFQILDDLLGIWGDPNRTGKPVGSDLARRKATLPVVAALNSQTPAAIELAALYCLSTDLTPAQIERATILVEDAGGRDTAYRCADERIEAARAALPDGVRADDLLALAQLILRRQC